MALFTLEFLFAVVLVFYLVNCFNMKFIHSNYRICTDIIFALVAINIDISNLSGFRIFSRQTYIGKWIFPGE